MPLVLTIPSGFEVCGKQESENNNLNKRKRPSSAIDKTVRGYQLIHLEVKHEL